MLLLVHGFGGGKDNFTRAARFLTPHYRVVIPDLPGFGDPTGIDGAGHHMAAQVALARLFPRSQVRIMEGIGHLPMAEVPMQSGAGYLAFRRTLPSVRNTGL